MKYLLVCFYLSAFLLSTHKVWAGETDFYTYKNREFVSKGSIDSDFLKSFLSLGNAEVSSLGPNTLSSVERALIEYLFVSSKALWESGSTERIHEVVLLNYGSYFLQFVPLSINGKSMIHIRGGRIDPKTFEGELIFAADGGIDFWSVNYFPKSKTFTQWQVNDEF